MDKKGNGAAGCAVPFPFKNTDYRFKAISPDLIRFALRNTSEKNKVITAGSTKLVQNKTGASDPGLKVHYAFPVLQIVFYHGSSVFFFFRLYICPDPWPSGRHDLVDQLLIRASHNDPACLISVFQPVRMDHIFNTASASDKFFLGDHAALHFQKIAMRLYIQPQMPPAAFLYIKGFLY